MIKNCGLFCVMTRINTLHAHANTCDIAPTVQMRNRNEKKNQNTSFPRGCKGTPWCSQGLSTRTEHRISSEQEKGSAPLDFVSLPFSRHMQAGLQAHMSCIFLTATGRRVIAALPALWSANGHTITPQFLLRQ